MESNPAESGPHRLFSLSLDLLCVAGFDGYFKEVNPAWTRVLGWSAEELLARPVEDFMHPEDRVRSLAAREELKKGVPLYGLENRYLCKDGSYRWLSWHSVCVPGEDKVFAVARDITERRQNDEEQWLASKLESTRILAGGIAHDYNNLFASLLLNLDMIELCGELNERQADFLRNAKAAVTTAGSLTQQLVTIAKGGSTVRNVLDLRSVILQEVQKVSANTSVSLHFNLPFELWSVAADEVRLREVIRNLVLNALDATQSCGNLHVKAENVRIEKSVQKLQPGEYVRVQMEDDGCGIAPEILPKVFDPYFSTKQRGEQKGMGLGLSLSRTVIERHGGSITIASQPNVGTTVTFHLPRADTRPGNPA